MNGTEAGIQLVQDLMIAAALHEVIPVLFGKTGPTDSAFS
jgi:hypothetical protein